MATSAVAPAGTLPRARARRLLLGVLLGVSAYRVLSWLLLDIDLFSDEAYYWTWSQAPAWGYYSKPPVIAWIIAATTALLGDGELAVKAGAILITPVTAWIVWGIGRDHFDARTALAAALLFFLMPGISMSQLVISTDVPLLLFWSLALWSWLRALRQPRRWSAWIACGAAAGLGLLSKYNMALFAAAALVHLAAERRLDLLRRPQLWAAVAVALALFAPNLAWNAAYGFPTLEHTAEISQLGHHGPRPGRLLEFLGAQFGVFGPVSFGALCLLAWRQLRNRPLRPLPPSPPPVQALACFTFVPLAAILLQALLARALANWAAPAYVGAALWLAWQLTRQPRWLRLALAANLLLMVTAYQLPLAFQAVGSRMPRSVDLYARVRGWEEVGAQVAALAAAHPDAILLFDERNYMAEALYYAGKPAQTRIWAPPTEPVRSQYHLAAPLTGGAGPVLYFARGAPREAIVAAFDRAARVGRVDFSPTGRQQSAPVYRLEGFGGYPETPRQRRQ